MDLRAQTYSKAAPWIINGDVLLRRSGGCVDEVAIAAAGRGPWIHAAMAGWWNGVLMLLEIRQWVGGRAVTLESQVDAAPGRWDVFRVCDERHGPSYPEGLRLAALREMQKICGRRYGWWNLLKLGLRHAVVVRMFAGHQLDDRENGSAPFCSQAVARAWRTGGAIDLVPHLADAATEPSDLARSALLNYRFTLY